MASTLLVRGCRACDPCGLCVRTQRGPLEGLGEVCIENISENQVGTPGRQWAPLHTPLTLASPGQPAWWPGSLVATNHSPGRAGGAAGRPQGREGRGLWAQAKGRAHYQGPAPRTPCLQLPQPHGRSLAPASPHAAHPGLPREQPLSLPEDSPHTLPGLSAFCLHKRHVPRELACGHRGARPLPLTAPRHQLACLPAGRGPWLSPPTRATQFLHCLSSPISSCPASLPLWGPPADPAAAPGGASRVPTPTSHPGRLQPSEPPAGALCHTQPTPYVTAARLQHHPGGLTLLAPTVPGKARLKLRLHGGYKMLCSGSEKG